MSGTPLHARSTAGSMGLLTCVMTCAWLQPDIEDPVRIEASCPGRTGKSWVQVTRKGAVYRASYAAYTYQDLVREINSDGAIVGRVEREEIGRVAPEQFAAWVNTLAEEVSAQRRALPERTGIFDGERCSLRLIGRCRSRTLRTPAGSREIFRVFQEIRSLDPRNRRRYAPSPSPAKRDTEAGR